MTRKCRSATPNTGGFVVLSPACNPRWTSVRISKLFGAQLCCDFAACQRALPAGGFCDGKENVLGLGRDSGSPVAFGEPGFLAFQPRWAVAAEPRPVFLTDGVLLLALLERRKAICNMGCRGAWCGQWFPAGPRGFFASAVARFLVGWNKIVESVVSIGLRARRDCCYLGRRADCRNGRLSLISQGHA